MTDIVGEIKHSYSLWTWHKDETGAEYGTCPLHGMTWRAGQDICHGCFHVTDAVVFHVTDAVVYDETKDRSGQI